MNEEEDLKLCHRLWGYNYTLKTGFEFLLRVFVFEESSHSEKEYIELSCKQTIHSMLLHIHLYKQIEHGLITTWKVAKPNTNP